MSQLNTKQVENSLSACSTQRKLCLGAARKAIISRLLGATAETCWLDRGSLPRILMKCTQWITAR